MGDAVYRRVRESEPWWTLLRDMEDGGEQDGRTVVIDGVEHIYGCTRDRRCFVDNYGLPELQCDCPCHNGEMSGAGYRRPKVSVETEGDNE